MGTQKSTIELIIVSISSSYQQVRKFCAQHPRLVLGAKFAAVFVLFYLISWRKLDPDFGWHLQSGNYIRGHGLPAHDIYTYTAPHFPWIDHEWGNDVILSLVYGLGGYALAAVLYALLWTGALLLSGLRTRMSVLILGVLAVAPYAGIRAIAWTAFFLGLVLWLLRSRRQSIWWLLPLIFIAWANLHAGFVIGLFAVIYTAVYTKQYRLLGLALVCGLATFINGYGPRLYEEVARTLFDRSLHSQIGEWAPFSFPAPAVVFITVWGAWGVLFEARTLKKWLRFSVILLLAAASATRNVPLFVVAALRETNGYFSSFIKSLPAKLTRGGAYWVRGMGAVAALAILYCAYTQLWPLRINPETRYPMAAVSYLKTYGCGGGHLYNDYNYGGYLIWRLPEQKVYIDGRMPSWRDPGGQKYLNKYYALLDHPSTYHTVFAAYNIRCALIQKTPRSAGLIKALEHNNWRAVIDARRYVLQIEQ